MPVIVTRDQYICHFLYPLALTNHNFPTDSRAATTSLKYGIYNHWKHEIAPEKTGLVFLSSLHPLHPLPPPPENNDDDQITWINGEE